MVRKARVTKARQPTKPPVGYGLYKVVHRLRWGSTVMLSPRGYRHAPLRAWETAIGLRPRKQSLVGKVRRRYRTARGIRG